MQWPSISTNDATLKPAGGGGGGHERENDVEAGGKENEAGDESGEKDVVWSVGEVQMNY